MQTTLPAGRTQRLLYYTSTLYVEQLNEGMNYTELRPAISIYVLTKSLFSETGWPCLSGIKPSSAGCASAPIRTTSLKTPKLGTSKLRETVEQGHPARSINAFVVAIARSVRIDCRDARWRGIIRRAIR